MSQEPRADSFAVLHEQTQALVIDFLNADLDLAFTFVESARVEAGSDDVHAKSLLEKAKAALKAVRHFQGRIEAPEAWTAINERAVKLEAALVDVTEFKR